MIYINDIPSFRDPESFKLIVDDRVTKIDLINGVAVQDFGYIPEGDAFSIVCMFSSENFNRVSDLWTARKKVSFTDIAGVTWQGLRIVLKEVEYDKNFPDYVIATFELWRA